jgi:hypothetical protein
MGVMKEATKKRFETDGKTCRAEEMLNRLEQLFLGLQKKMELKISQGRSLGLKKLMVRNRCSEDRSERCAEVLFEIGEWHEKVTNQMKTKQEDSTLTADGVLKYEDGHGPPWIGRAGFLCQLTSLFAIALPRFWMQMYLKRLATQRSLVMPEKMAIVACIIRVELSDKAV